MFSASQLICAAGWKLDTYSGNLDIETLKVNNNGKMLVVSGYA
jgi:hypothetical protein